MNHYKEEEIGITLLYKNIRLFIYFERGSNFQECEKETDGGGRRLKDFDTAILTHNFFSWPLYAVLYS